MRLESRTPHTATTYRPSHPDQRAAELAQRNGRRLEDYFVRQVEHALEQDSARSDRQQQLRCAYVARRAG